MRLTAYRPTAELMRLVDALGGSWSGYRALCRCPAHTDKTPSLSVRQGDRGILVHCFAGCNSGDVLREMARIARIPATQSVDRSDHEDRPNVNVRRLWDESVDISGTLAARYLDRRAIGSVFSDLRYHPRCPRGVKPNTVFAPALMVAARTDTELLAIQRIFLAPDGRALEKLMIGRPGGASWRGNPPINDRLAIAEGFETAARFTMRTGIPCWASLGAARLPLIALPADLTELVIAEDDDAEGRAAGCRAWSAYTRPGLSIRRMPPPRRAGPQGDNDWARLD